MPKPPTALLLGCYHMANPGHDTIKVHADNVLAFRRQAEVADCVSRLAAFEPTKILVEWPVERADLLNARYRRYRRDEELLGPDELDQLGLRLAAALEHDRIYPVDWNLPGPEIDVLTYAAEHQPDLHAEIMALLDAMGRREQRVLEDRTIAQILLHLNSTDQYRENTEIYLLIAQIGVGTEYPGAEWVAHWHGRNLRIFANIRRITEPEDRLLILYGSGHVPELAACLSGCGAYDLADVASYLAEEGE